MLVLFLAPMDQCSAQESPTSVDPLRPIVLGWERFSDEQEYAGDDSEREQELLGRVLLTELSCTACHRAESDPSLTPKQGPRLDGIGARRSTQWLQTFLRDPRQAKPGTTMPHCLPNDPAVLESLVALLSQSRVQLLAEIPASKDGDPLAASFQRGKQWFGEKGCAACHVTPGEGDTDSRVPLQKISERYELISLTQFLREPLTLAPHSRMPDLKLEILEAADLAAFLLGSQNVSTTQADVIEANNELIERGRREFIERACVQCHEFEELEPSKVAKPLADLRLDASESCLSGSSPELPRWNLTTAQSEAIIAALRQTKDEPLEEAELASQQLDTMLIGLNCTACHWRVDSQRYRWGGVPQVANSHFRNVGNYDLGDEGRLPPTLNRVGAKFQETWLMQTLRGETRMRPYLSARMPSYPGSIAEPLAELLVKVDRTLFEQSALEPLSKIDEDSSQIGLEFVDQSCVQCHPIAGKSMVGVVGVDLAGLETRLRREWFDAYMRAPTSLRPGTRMPDFFPQGRSSVPAIARGDVNRQVAGLWDYLRRSDLPIPPRITADELVDFELHPIDRPILQRTFFEEVGTHALVIGFPQQLSLAFDMQTGSLKRAWKGRFIDAHGTWFDRFAPPAKPLGDVLEVPLGFGIWHKVTMSGEDRTLQTAEAEGLGYELDENGIPTILQRVDDLEVSVRWEVQTVNEADASASSLRIDGTLPVLALQTDWALGFELGAGEFDSSAKTLTIGALTIQVHVGELIESDGSWCLIPIREADVAKWSCELTWRNE